MAANSIATARAWRGRGAPETSTRTFYTGAMWRYAWWASKFTPSVSRPRPFAAARGHLLDRNYTMSGTRQRPCQTATSAVWIRHYGGSRTGSTRCSVRLLRSLFRRPAAPAVAPGVRPTRYVERKTGFSDMRSRVVHDSLFPSSRGHVWETPTWYGRGLLLPARCSRHPGSSRPVRARSRRTSRRCAGDFRRRIARAAA